MLLGKIREQYGWGERESAWKSSGCAAATATAAAAAVLFTTVTMAHYSGVVLIVGVLIASSIDSTLALPISGVSTLIRDTGLEIAVAASGVSALPISGDSGLLSDTDTMHVGDSLAVGGQLVSIGSEVKLCVQGDGNLVLYQTNVDDVPLWATNTGVPGDAGIHLNFQGDGNLVLYADQHPSTVSTGVLWASDTSSAQELVLQSDCNLVLRDASMNAVWASNTQCTPSPPPPPPGPAPPPGECV